jgi:hypothetical protein
MREAEGRDWGSAIRVSLACIRSALDNASACATESDRRAWLELARSEERRIARLVDGACSALDDLEPGDSVDGVGRSR